MSMLEEIKISTKEGAGSSGGIVIRKEAAIGKKKKEKGREKHALVLFQFLTLRKSLKKEAKTVPRGGA